MKRFPKAKPKPNFQIKSKNDLSQSHPLRQRFRIKVTALDGGECTAPDPAPKPSKSSWDAKKTKCVQSAGRFFPQLPVLSTKIHMVTDDEIPSSDGQDMCISPIRASGGHAVPAVPETQTPPTGQRSNKRDHGRTKGVEQTLAPYPKVTEGDRDEDLNSGSPSEAQPTTSTEVLGVISNATFGQILLVKTIDGTLVVEKRLFVKNIERKQALDRRCTIENPVTECQVFDDVQAKGGHDCILRKLDHTYRSGQLILTLEFAEGGDMLEALKKRRFSPEILRVQFSQIVSAMHFLYECGWANLDLSPENILLKGPHKMQPALMDFGMSLRTTDQVSGFRGKEAYAAPELWNAYQNPCKPTNADMWSLGILLFTMLTSRPLFNRALNNQRGPFKACPVYSAFVKYMTANPACGLAMLLTKLGLLGHFTRDSLDLLRGLLQIEPEARMSISNVLAHPFCNTQL